MATVQSQIPIPPSTNTLFTMSETEIVFTDLTDNEKRAIQNLSDDDAARTFHGKNCTETDNPRDQ